MSDLQVGRALKRFEDPKFLRGQAHFLDDLNPEGTRHLAILRSPFARAQILSIDATLALQMPGVEGVFTAKEVRRITPASTPREGHAVKQPVLAEGVVNYVGQPIAAVLARSAQEAYDALQAVLVDYDVQEAYPTVHQALHAPPLHPHLNSNVALRRTTRSGDVATAFATAKAVVGGPMVQQRVAPSPMETRGVLAQWDGTRESLTVWSSTQVPHNLRTALAETLGLDENRVRVVAPDVGGGFGAKLQVYPEEVLAAHLAQALHKPIKWVEKRSENLVSMVQGRAQVANLELALDAQGHILGLRGEVLADLGAYTYYTTLGTPAGTVFMLPGPYVVPALEVELVAVYTNATPSGAYRGAGRPEATYYIERLMDQAALELGLDPAEVRMRNLIRGPFPYTTLTGAKYDSGNYPQTLQRLLQQTNYPDLRAQQARAKAEGRWVGIGISSYVEITGFGWETGGVRVNPDGSAVVFTGTSPHGQGNATSFAQIVADRLGLEASRVQVVHGDTLAVPFGQGTAGSRTLLVGGSAVLQAALKVQDKMRQIAAHLLEAAPADLELVEQSWGVRGTDRRIAVREIAQTAYNPRKLPAAMEAGLEGQASFNLKDATYPFGAHLAMVELDADTGQITVLKYFALDDCGTIVNPLLVEGQVHGGVAQAIGQAYFEGIVYDPSGQNLTASLLEYTFPRADQIPWLDSERGQTPSPNNPLGAKGVGEAGTIGGTPAAVAAVLDALQIKHLDMPLTPEKVWRAMRQGESQ